MSKKPAEEPLVDSSDTLLPTLDKIQEFENTLPQEEKPEEVTIKLVHLPTVENTIESELESQSVPIKLVYKGNKFVQ